MNAEGYSAHLSALQPPPARSERGRGDQTAGRGRDATLQHSDCRAWVLPMSVRFSRAVKTECSSGLASEGLNSTLPRQRSIAAAHKPASDDDTTWCGAAPHL